jgi:hypothetical protein
MLVALLGIGLLALVFFVALQGWGPASFVLVAVLALSAATALLGLRTSGMGHLRWDGAQWHWAGQQDYHVNEVSCVLDLQLLLLLRLRCHQGPRLWVWLESGRMDASWLAMRRALVAGASAAEPRADNSLPP